MGTWTAVCCALQDVYKVLQDPDWTASPYSLYAMLYLRKNRKLLASYDIDVE